MIRVSLITRKTRLFICTGTMLALAGLASAQARQYDANCNKKDYTADEQLQQELCSSHMGCKLVMLAEKACKVKDFLGSLGGVLDGRSKPDNYDVMQALNQTEVVQTPGVRETNLSAAKSIKATRLPSYDRSNAAEVDWQQVFYGPPPTGNPQGYLNRDAGGAVRWFEGTGNLNGSNQWTGAGVQIDSKAGIKVGDQANDAMEGAALKRGSDGSWTGGSFKGGNLSGAGYSADPTATGKSPVMEGTFLNGQADGMMLVTYPDFSSRKELWRGGKMVAAGPKVPKGQFPQNPKTPEEEAAEKAAADEAAFSAKLTKEANPGGLYALGDEWAEKGDMTKAKAAWRELLKRFPDSTLASKAADRLSGGGSATVSPGQAGSAGISASYSGPVSLTGEWRGEGSGNVVYLSEQGGAILVSAVTQNAGQDPNAMRFSASGDGSFTYTWPGGEKATVTVTNQDRIEVVQPTWSEVFLRAGKSASAPAPSSCSGSPSEAFQAFDREFASMSQQYPLNQSWGMRDTYKYSIFFGTRGLQILEKYKACMSPSDYSSNYSALSGAVTNGTAGCQQTSSDGGRGCVAEYPN